MVAFGLKAETPSHLKDKDAETVRRIVLEEVKRQADLERASKAPVMPQPIDVHIHNPQSNSSGLNPWIPSAFSLITSLVALWSVLEASNRATAASLKVSQESLQANEALLALQNELKYAEIVIDALKFFGSKQGTQSWGVGIAVIRANIDNADFVPYRATWRAVLE